MLNIIDESSLRRFLPHALATLRAAAQLSKFPLDQCKAWKGTDGVKTNGVTANV